ncbi:tubulin-specific chaperone A-like [Halichondria panicea]|uniref:tubulin-specific chaperone A-like n=1 Tax=Halichondria panicea TaxID=6063 RepID=UPI00312B310E
MAERQLKIKTGVVKRLFKEKQMYEKEVVDQEEKVEKMKVDGKDEYDIKKQGEVLQESRSMVPDCQRRLEAARIDLTRCVESYDEDLKETATYKAAQEILATVPA